MALMITPWHATGGRWYELGATLPGCLLLHSGSGLALRNQQPVSVTDCQ